MLFSFQCGRDLRETSFCDFLRSDPPACWLGCFICRLGPHLLGCAPEQSWTQLQTSFRQHQAKDKHAGRAQRPTGRAASHSSCSLPTPTPPPRGPSCGSPGSGSHGTSLGPGRAHSSRRRPRLSHKDAEAQRRVTAPELQPGVHTKGGLPQGHESTGYPGTRGHPQAPNSRESSILGPTRGTWN